MLREQKRIMCRKGKKGREMIKTKKRQKYLIIDKEQGNFIKIK